MQNKVSRGTQFDCSARFYPIIASKKSQSLYHIGVQTDGDIDPQLLSRAIGDVLPRFPSFKTKLKRGYAWYRLAPNDAPVPVTSFDGQILKPLDKRQTGGYLFRASVSGSQFHMDFFHGLADGAGSLAFTLAIIRRLRQLEGREVPDGDGIADVSDSVTDEESEDAFLRYYKPIKLREADIKGMAGGVPHRRNGTPVEDGYNYSHYVADSAELMSVVKAAGASFTAYLAAIVARCVESMAGDGKPITLMIPVNLRAYFPSRTQRNFVLFIRIVIEQGKCKDLQDYIDEAKRQLADGLTLQKLQAQISTTVKGMTTPLMNVVPVCVKRMASRLGRLFMRSRQTVIISNLGRISIAPEYGVTDITYNLNVSKNNVQNIATTTFAGRTTFSFTSAIKENDLERAFADSLREQGVAAELARDKASATADMRG